jgi:hypothetical protein
LFWLGRYERMQTLWWVAQIAESPPLECCWASP